MPDLVAVLDREAELAFVVDDEVGLDPASLVRLLASLLRSEARDVALLAISEAREATSLPIFEVLEETSAPISDARDVTSPRISDTREAISPLRVASPLRSVFALERASLRSSTSPPALLVTAGGA